MKFYKTTDNHYIAIDKIIFFCDITDGTEIYLVDGASTATKKSAEQVAKEIEELASQ